MNLKVAWQMADSSRKNLSIWLSRPAIAWHTEPIIVFHGMIVHNRFYQKAMIKAVSSNISNHASIVLHDFSMYYTCAAVGESWVSESSGARMVRGPCHNASSRRDGLWVIALLQVANFWPKSMDVLPAHSIFGVQMFRIRTLVKENDGKRKEVQSTRYDSPFNVVHCVCSGAAAFRRARHDEEYRQDTWGGWKFMMELRS